MRKRIKELKKENEKSKKKKKWESRHIAHTKSGMIWIPECAENFEFGCMSRQDQMVEEVMSGNVEWETYFKKVFDNKIYIYDWKKKNL